MVTINMPVELSAYGSGLEWMEVEKNRYEIPMR
jgi:hypothetical protein